jgi:hypothetical protein
VRQILKNPVAIRAGGDALAISLQSPVVSEKMARFVETLMLVAVEH